LKRWVMSLTYAPKIEAVRSGMRYLTLTKLDKEGEYQGQVIRWIPWEEA